MPRRKLTGVVVSTKMEKTAVVAVEMVKKHPLYGKAVANTKKFKARDEIGVIEGDRVVIEESRPFSRQVTWIVKEKV